MSDFENEIVRLREKTEQNRREFLRTDIETCFIALDRARLELSLGNSHETKAELAMVSRGIEVIERFLGEARQPLTEIAEKLAKLKKSAESLRCELQSYP